MSTTTIVVVGAGVSGLTSALLLAQNKTYAITVVGKHMPGDYDIEYASPWAGANFTPMSSAADSIVWERSSWNELKRLAQEVPEAGIHMQTADIYRRNEDLADGKSAADATLNKDPWFKNEVEDYREMSPEEILPMVKTGLADLGVQINSLCINTAIYLPWLLGQCLKHGVVVKRAILTHINDAKSMSHTSSTADIIVNATGLGSLKLGGVEDDTMVPVRGQTVLVRNEFHPMLILSKGVGDGTGDLLYAMERAGGGGTILGGTHDVGNWDSVPDPNIALRIMKRIVDARPHVAGGKGIAGLDIISHNVGLRPHRRDGLRVETEKLDGETWVVHNYGHSGRGYQTSYGCAQKVVALVDEAARHSESILIQ